jgi:hypothetical protein
MGMIEIERKFFLTAPETVNLEQSLGSASQRQQMHDVYAPAAAADSLVARARRMPRVAQVCRYGAV